MTHPNDKVRLLSNFTKWADLTPFDIAIAYRKAKSDCFWEKSVLMTDKLVAFEQNLDANLKNLTERLRRDDGPAKLLAEPDHIGSWYLLPKKVAFTKPAAATNAPNVGNGPAPSASPGKSPTWFTSDPKRAVDRVIAEDDLNAEFRTMADFSVERHIISALWVCRVGHKFDDCLSRNIYGSRLHRYRSRTEDAGAVSGLNPLAYGCFEPYVFPYMRWRDNAMARIREELDDGQDVICVTLDLQSYYHNVDPAAVTNSALHKQLRRGDGTEFALTQFEVDFTGAIVNSLTDWQAHVRSDPNLGPAFPVGLPLGDAASRVIANVVLAPWDKLVAQRVAPLYYGRYVDDMILVLRDGGGIDPDRAFKHLVADRLDHVDGKAVIDPPGGNCPAWKINDVHGALGATKLLLSNDKLKFFQLRGESGKDFIATLNEMVRKLSSERRLMPDPMSLMTSPAAKLLAADEAPGDDADSLRRATGLHLRRFAWSVQLRDVETLAADLPAKAWTLERQNYYRFAENHLLRLDKLLAGIDALPRLLGLAIRCGDWASALRMATTVMTIASQLGNLLRARSAQGAGRPAVYVKVNGSDLSASAQQTGVWVHDQVRATLKKLLLDTILKNWTHPYRSRGLNCVPLDALSLLRLVAATTPDDKPTNDHLRAVLETARIALVADLASRSWLAVLTDATADLGDDVPVLHRDAGCLLEPELAELALVSRFIAAAKARWPRAADRIDSVGVLYATRRIRPAIVALAMPDAVFQLPLDLTAAARTAEKPDSGCTPQDSTTGRAGHDADRDPAEPPTRLWARLLVALRGLGINPDAIDPECIYVTACRPDAILGSRQSADPRIAVANAEVTPAEWTAAVDGSPALTVERYSRVGELVNQAIRSPSLRAGKGNSYLILPELYLPRRFVASVANRLLGERISLIAGVEYSLGDQHSADNTVVMYLRDRRLGFESQIAIEQPKLVPAPKEGYDLLHRANRRLPMRAEAQRRWPPVIVHDGFAFAVLICSELLNIRYLARLRGQVDAVIVPAWNRDLHSFSAVVEATAIDMHGFVAVANARMYGDSRVRSPAKNDWQRDLCRIQGSMDDHVVVATLPVAELRDFQRNAQPWPHDNDKFKPVPDGFVLASWRKT